MPRQRHTVTHYPYFTSLLRLVRGRRSPTAQQGRAYTYLMVVGLLFLLGGCETPGGDACGGVETQVSCVSITRITPTSETGGSSSNVDAVQDVCEVDALGFPSEFEPFTDHNADIVFANTTFPGATNGLPVTIQRYAVSYTLNNCPPQAAGCPPLPGFSVDGQTLVIPAGGTSTATFPFVPLAVKGEYIEAGGETGLFAPSYTVHYVFTAQTQFFSDTITFKGSATFTITNFDLCP